MNINQPGCLKFELKNHKFAKEVKITLQYEEDDCLDCFKFIITCLLEEPSDFF